MKLVISLFFSLKKTHFDSTFTEEQLGVPNGASPDKLQGGGGLSSKGLVFREKMGGTQASREGPKPATPCSAGRIR